MGNASLAEGKQGLLPAESTSESAEFSKNHASAAWFISGYSLPMVDHSGDSWVNNPREGTWDERRGPLRARGSSGRWGYVSKRFEPVASGVEVGM